MSEHERRNKELREASNDVQSSDPLVCFLYMLMRDELKVGEVEELVNRVRLGPQGSIGQYTFTNGWLAKYAMNLRDELTREHTKPIPPPNLQFKGGKRLPPAENY